MNDKFEGTKMSPSLHAKPCRVEGALRTKLTEHVWIGCKTNQYPRHKMIRLSFDGRCWQQRFVTFKDLKIGENRWGKAEKQFSCWGNSWGNFASY